MFASIGVAPQAVVVLSRLCGRGTSQQRLSAGRLRPRTPEVCRINLAYEANPTHPSQRARRNRDLGAFCMLHLHKAPRPTPTPDRTVPRDGLTLSMPQF